MNEYVVCKGSPVATIGDKISVGHFNCKCGRGYVLQATDFGRHSGVWQEDNIVNEAPGTNVLYAEFGTGNLVVKLNGKEYVLKGHDFTREGIRVNITLELIEVLE
jgi:hypothetical protein